MFACMRAGVDANDREVRVCMIKCGLHACVFQGAHVHGSVCASSLSAYLLCQVVYQSTEDPVVAILVAEHAMFEYSKDVFHLNLSLNLNSMSVSEIDRQRR